MNIYIYILAAFMISCNESHKADYKTALFSKYYSAQKNDSNDKWNFTTDTVKLWFDNKDAKPIIQVKGKKATGKWKEWDSEMKSNSYYDTIWFDKSENAIKGYFYEKNDFYSLIGKPPTKTLRTYWFDVDDKIKEILIYWIPEENTITAEYLKPIVNWAMTNDSTEIKQLYPNGNIVPSRKNAIRWKNMIQKYQEEKNSYKHQRQQSTN